MANLREWLNEQEFDWDKGKIVYQYYEEDPTHFPGWGSPDKAKIIVKSEPVLDYEFDSGFGGANAPRIIAMDNVAIYIIGQYDGSTWMEKIYKDIDVYANMEAEVPYIGG